MYIFDFTRSMGAVAVVVTTPVTMLVANCAPMSSFQPVARMMRLFTESYVAHCDAVRMDARICRAGQRRGVRK